MSEVSSNGVTSGEVEVKETAPSSTTKKSPLKGVGDAADTTNMDSTVIKSPIKSPVKICGDAKNGNGISSTSTEDNTGTAAEVSVAKEESETAITSTEQESTVVTSADKSPVKSGVANATTKEPKAAATADIVSEIISSTSEKELDTEKDALKSTTKSPAKNGEESTEPSENDKMEEEGEKNADYYLARGKRDLTIRDYPSAVDFLSKACEKLSAIHGEFGDELGDAYFLYGKALLASYREESGVLGDKIEKEQEGVGDDDEEGDEEDEEEGGATEGNGAEGKSEEVGSTDTPRETADNGTAEDGSAENGEVAETDGDDLQLSWQFLEMAKVIFARKADEDKEIGIKLSEVYLTLGENGLESESYSTAVTDFETCLELQKKNMSADDRRMAETLYQMGMAYGLMEKFEEAVAQFEASIAQLQKRLDTLDAAKKADKKQPDGESYDTFYSLEGEQEEINQSIKEIRDKIADMHDYKKHLKEEVMKSLMGEGFGIPTSTAGESSTSGSSSAAEPAASSPFDSSVVTEAKTNATTPAASKPISNISHLVRKKRKNDDEPEKEDKRVKTDEGVSQ